MNKRLTAAILVSLLAAALPAHAQVSPQYNPLAMLVLTPLGAVLVPVLAPRLSPANGYHPVISMPAPAAPQGMVPFSGLQETPQDYGMPTASPYPVMPPPQYPMPTAYPRYPVFPFPFAR